MHVEIMHDIETMSTKANAIVVSLGAVKFSSNDTDSYDTIKDDPDRTFYARLDIESQEEAGRDISASTFQWWLKQSNDARAAFLHKSMPVLQVLEAFSAWAEGSEYIWGNGATFDNVIMRNLYAAYGMPFPIEYWGDLDMRTLVKLNGGEKPKYPIAVAHNALDDAMLQTLQVQHITRDLLT